MNRTILALFAAALFASPVYSQEQKDGSKAVAPKKEMTAQQKRMQQCNADAKKQQFKGKEERQAFMSACLKGERPMSK